MFMQCMCIHQVQAEHSDYFAHFEGQLFGLYLALQVPDASICILQSFFHSLMGAHGHCYSI